MRPLIYHPEARIDLAAAIAFYRRDGGTRLGTRFMMRVQSAIDTIRRDPAACPEIQDGIGRQRVWRFPYDLIFKEVNDTVMILAVAHHSRNADYWMGRK